MIKQKIFDTIYPPNLKCVICGREVDFLRDHCLCEKCRKALPFLELENSKNKICSKCGAPIFSKSEYCLNCQNSSLNFDVNRSVFRYVDPIKKLIVGYKYNNQKYLYTFFALIMAEYYKKLNWDIDLIISIPLHYERIKTRKYNQSELVAAKMSEVLNVPINANLIERVKNTMQQTRLSKEQREENVKDAFKVLRSQDVKDKNILLVDDVYTTGATLSECAKELKKFKPKRIFAMTIAHANNDKSI